MFPRIPRGTPPPAYVQLALDPPGFRRAVTPPPIAVLPPASPDLAELEIETFGRQLATATVPVTIQLPEPSNPPTSTVNTVSERVPVAGGTKRKSSATVPDVPLTTTFEMLVHVLQPDKKVRNKTRQTKTVKVDPIKVGPTNVALNTDWESFVSTIATLLATTVPHLKVPSFEWHFLRPANSPWLPLHNESGWQSLLGQALTKIKKDGSTYIILRMNQPTYPATSPTLPWAIGHGSGANNPPQAQPLPPAQDEDEITDDDSGIGPTQKKARLDDELEEIAAKLEDKYPIGLCDEHKDKHCFHYRPTGLHFELTRPRRLVWAAKIREGKPGVTYDLIPIGSGMFTAEQAMKIKKKAKAIPEVEQVEPATPKRSSPLSPTTPRRSPISNKRHRRHRSESSDTGHGSYEGSHSRRHYPGSMYYPPYPTFNPAPFFAPPAFQNPYEPPRNWNRDRDRSPTPGPSRNRDRDQYRHMQSSSPPIPKCTVHDFCVQYELEEDIEASLANLKFKIGDDIDSLPEKEWTEAGFKLLSWRRVLKAYHKFKAAGTQ